MGRIAIAFEAASSSKNSIDRVHREKLELQAR